MNKNFDWIYGIWFVPSKDDTRDWLGMIGKEKGKWIVRYRFRYYSPQSRDPHDKHDTKNEYAFSAKDDSQESLDRIVACTKDIVMATEIEFGEKHDFIDLQCDNADPKVFFELGSRPWSHMKIESLR